MLTCIILNYNDSESVITLYNKIKDYKIIDLFILVDNLSTDNSFEELKKLEDSKTKVILSDKNGGYGYGNNLGLRYSKQVGANYAIVCNPDTEFSEQAIINSLELFKTSEKCAAVSPKVNCGEIAYKFASPLLEICYSNLLLNKLFKPRSYQKAFFEGKKSVVVDVIPGSFTIFDVEKFMECGLYDEEVFLYHEEIIVGKRLNTAGYIQMINLSDEYIHKHHVSVKKNFKSEVKLKKIVLNSQKIYLKKYCKASCWILFLHDLMRPINYLEMAIWSKIKK